MLTQERVLIIGGGIGGLSLALALHRLRIPVQVYEQAPKLQEVGAGLGVWMNAVRVLDELGVGDRIRKISFPLKVGELCSSSGRVLSRFDIEEALGEEGAANFIMHRADLQRILAEALPPETIVTGATCVGVEQDELGVVAHFKDRIPERGGFLVGADGINSVVRSELWGDQPVRYSGQTCYRGVAEVSLADHRLIREIQGAGKRAALCPLSPDRVYWWAAVNAPFAEVDDPNLRVAQLLETFDGWPFGLPDVIAATAEGSVLRNDLIDRAPIPRWSSGRVTLLGDAAHPMLPNLGQGACTALEDSLVLARSLAEASTADEAFRRYEAERVGRTTRIVRDSWRFGRPLRWKHPATVWVRERLLSMLPERLVSQQISKHIRYDAGSLPVAV